MRLNKSGEKNMKLYAFATLTDTAKPCLSSDSPEVKSTEILPSLLPTPKAGDFKSAGEHGQGGQDLRTTLSLLPTPTQGSDRKTKYKQGGTPLGMALTCLQAASPASHSVKPAKGGERMIAAFCGQRCFKSSGTQSLGGSSLKTFLDYLVLKGEWSSSKCVLTWKRKVTKYGRSLFQLVPSMLPTEGTECGLLHTTILPTPSTKDVSGGAVEAIPTITGFKRVSKQGISHGAQLHDVIKMLPTASARDWKDGNSYGKVEEKSILPMRVGNKTGLKLQPSFVCWMQGYPIGWTDITIK